MTSCPGLLIRPVPENADVIYEPFQAADQAIAEVAENYGPDATTAVLGLPEQDKPHREDPDTAAARALHTHAKT